MTGGLNAVIEKIHLLITVEKTKNRKGGGNSPLKKQVKGKNNVDTFLKNSILGLLEFTSPFK